MQRCLPDDPFSEFAFASLKTAGRSVLCGAKSAVAAGLSSKASVLGLSFCVGSIVHLYGPSPGPDSLRLDHKKEYPRHDAACDATAGAWIRFVPSWQYQRRPQPRSPSSEPLLCALRRLAKRAKGLVRWPPVGTVRVDSPPSDGVDRMPVQWMKIRMRRGGQWVGLLLMKLGVRFQF